MGGMGGGGGMGGAGGATGCASDQACDDLNACTTDTCNNGMCENVALDGIPTPGVMDKPGDCNTPLCVAGEDLLVPDDQDVPDDGLECTLEACANGMLTTTNATAGVPCGVNMDLVCNGQGLCVGCTVATDCGPDTTCQTQTCNAGTCGVQNAPAGTFVDDGLAGDCQQNECNGVGGITSGPKNTDLPADDGNACTDEICSGGMPLHPFASAGAACNANGGTYCNGAGSCVECLTAATCPGQDTACQTRSCNGNQCGMSFEPAGTLLAGQTMGDCQLLICNGMGMTTSTIDNADLPLSDNNVCTDEVCANGSPQHAPVLDMTPCSQGGGTFCSAGTCVQCVTVADCPGMDSECRVRTCNAGMCGNIFTAAGTPLQAQVPGNCQLEQCNGMGSVTSTVDDTDLPVDTLQCTLDTCSSGTPSNAPLPIGSMCTQNGGTICNGQGACVPTADVVSILPTDGQLNVSPDATLRVTFSTAMNPLSLTGQTSYGPCSGTVQVSADNFNSCFGFSSAAPAMNLANDIATYTPAAFFSYFTQYKVRVTTAAQSAGGVPISMAYAQPNGFTIKAPPVPCGGSVVISQIFSSGGDLGATWRRDFVELHNRGNTPVSVAGWSVQYAYPFGSFNSVPGHTTPLTGTIPAGGYYLIQLSGDVNGTIDLPNPDAIGTTDFDSATGKVALVSNATPLTGGCPLANPALVDFVGYGPFTNCFEGAAAAPAPSTATTSLLRADDGCTDTGNNTSDFASTTATPRNTSSPTNICVCGANVTANETGRADELDYCNIQFPLSISVGVGQSTPTIYGRAYEAGITDPAGADPNIHADVGFGPANVNPLTQSGFVFFPMTYNMQYGNDDEYQGAFTAPATPGSYRYVVRFSRNGVSWTYCDPDGAGSNAGLAFDFVNLPVLDVTP